MSAMANTTPIVTTVTKPATNLRDADATPRLTSKISVKNITRTSYQSLWTRSVVTSEKRSMLAKPTRRAQPSPYQEGQAPRIILVVEVARTSWTLLIKVVLRIGNASVALRSRMMIPLLSLLSRQTPLPPYEEKKGSTGRLGEGMGFWRENQPWGIDIAGPFTEGPGKVKFLIVAMDYFTKRIEAKAVATITGIQKEQTRCLGEGIKARLGERNKNWVEELSHVLWAHHTMIKSSHCDTPFSLTYETKATIPAEIEMPTYRTATVDVVYNDEELRLNLNLLEERRERATFHEAKAKLKMTKYYNARVHDVTFRPGDFVYRSNDVNHAVAGGKLRPK
nr:hypothetical protein [Tanacetum cinerariifolium]